MRSAWDTEIERWNDLRNRTEIFLFLFVMAKSSGCLSCFDESLEWKTVKSEIRERFPSVSLLSTQELAAWLSKDSGPLPLLVDVRAPEEYAVSHLPDAILASSEEEVLEVLKGVDRERPVVFYCSVGYRSARMAERIGEKGYTNVYNLEGSIFQWANEGRAVYRGTEKVAVVHPYDARWGKLLSSELWSYTWKDDPM